MTTEPPATPVPRWMDATHLLLTLAWCGQLTGPQIQRLHFADRHINSVNRMLNGLQEAGCVHGQHWARSRADQRGGPGAPPVRQPRVWSLTEKGHRLLQGHRQYPTRPVRTPRPQHSSTTRSCPLTSSCG